MIRISTFNEHGWASEFAINDRPLKADPMDCLGTYTTIKTDTGGILAQVPLGGVLEISYEEGNA